MTDEQKQAIQILQKEYLCVDRDCDIERSCGKCDLMMPNKEPILKAYKVAIKALEQEPKWIPMTTRPMTKEEQEHYREWSDVVGAMIFDCELPEDGQEVLVSYGGYVLVDTFCKDDGCYFEGVDIDDVEAWMPLPKPYKAEGEDEE